MGNLMVVTAITAGLIVLSAFFVVIEFALLGARQHRLEKEAALRQLVAKGWLRKAGPDKLIVTSLPGRHFAEFDLETLEHFYTAAREILRLVEKRSRS